MKNAIKGILALFLFCYACTSAPPSIPQQVQQLKTDEDKKAFLEQVHDDDQGVRGGEDAAIILKYGVDSEEYMAYVQAQWDQDAINLEKVDQYLSQFGHPKKEEVGSKAASTPYLVVHHQTDVGLRNSYFSILYEAYLNEDIRSSSMCLYLGRTYEFIHRERLQMTSPYTEEDEINALIEALGLDEKE